MKNWSSPAVPIDIHRQHFDGCTAYRPRSAFEQLESLQDRIAVLEADLEAKDERIAHLERDRDRLEDRTAELERHVEDLEDEISRLESLANVALKGRVESLGGGMLR
ncbi:hypothetical protein EA472_21070 [Natrarchaeobius oligotrophus]|uniref:Uncharacterized protein n=1 Tax=Natrarchaeobius chitinivorans TaxID=1679083 RepID=A0A3N6LY51_NATCH|nr:hypothetical protein EA472_21070 [Natrarchaeobius chitinivorans]